MGNWVTVIVLGLYANLSGCILISRKGIISAEICKDSR